MTRLRIAYLVPPSGQFAGIERVVHELATGLMREHGDVLDIHVVYCSMYDVPELRDPAYTMHTLGVDRLLRIPGPLRNLLRRERFDALVCPQVEATVIGWHATRKVPIALISHLHGNPQLEEAEGSLRTRMAFQLYRRFVARACRMILAVSPSLAAFAAEELAGKTPVMYAKNPVRTLPVLRDAPDDVFDVVCVARLSRQKGQDVLLRAIAQALPELPPTRVHLVGNGPAEDALQELTAELGLEEIVDFTGYIADPSPYLARADCFALVSRWEGFGVALVEAMQYGIPIVTTDCRFGPSDVVDDPRIGIVAGTEDVTSIASALVSTARRGRDADDESGRQLAAATYTPEAATQSHFEILTSVLTKDAPPAPIVSPNEAGRGRPAERRNRGEHPLRPR